MSEHKARSKGKRMKTIWSKDSLPLVSPRFRSLLRVVMPTTDVGMIIFGLSSFIVRSQTIDAVVTPWFSFAWSVLILGGALLSLYSLIFLHFRPELWGRCAVVLGLLVYGVATTAHAITDTPSAVLPLILTMLRIVPALWRINDLASEIARVEAAHDA